MRRIFISLCFGFVVILFAGTLYFLRGKQSADPSDTFTIVATTSSKTATARQAPNDWREYRNVAYHFSLFYPPEFKVKEHSEGEGATTITFQNIQTGEGFQIFILPYKEQQISEERFKRDVSSGIRKNMADVTIDGVVGATFYSTNVLLGETAEVWFIKDGFLYEVTTLRSLDQWLSKIMQTWLFIN